MTAGPTLPGHVSFHDAERAKSTRNPVKPPMVTGTGAFAVSPGFFVRNVTQSKGLVTINLKEEAKGDRIRLVVKGTGLTPVLGKNLIPLAGALDDPPATADDGHDFVALMSLKERS